MEPNPFPRGSERGMGMNQRDQVLERLNRLGAPYVLHEHPAAYTMEDCQRLPFSAPTLTFCKNLLLCNRQQTTFYLLVISPERNFRTAELSHELGVSRLSFAPEDALPRLLGLERGSVSPLGLWFDREKQVRLLFERAVRRPGQIAFHPCDNTATVVFDQEVFWEQVVPSLTSSWRMVL